MPRSPHLSHGSIAPLLWAGWISLAAGAARAGEPAAARCEDPRVSLDEALSPVWRKAAIEACVALRDVPDTDPGVRLRVVDRSGEVLVEATLADGRSAVRQVAAPADLPLTLEALAVKPPPDRPPDSAAPPATTSPPSPILPPPVPSTSPRFQLGLWIAGRASGLPGYLSVGPALSADLSLGLWVVAFLGRWDAYQSVVSTELSGFSMQTAGAGLMAGRRVFERPGMRIDAGLHVVVLAQEQSFSAQAGDDDDDDDDAPAPRRAGSAADARMGLSARAALGSGALRWLLAIEAEISPFQIGGDVRVDPLGPALPGWSVGLAAGIGYSAGLPWGAR